jgi:RNA polymerase sigma-70 factor (ECF subfamily)
VRVSAIREESSELEAAFQSEAAFRAWYDRVLPRVFGYVLGHVQGSRELAEDITQQTFTDAIRGYRRFDRRSDSVTWLCSIARHKLADHWRRLERDERRRLRLIDTGADDGADARQWRSVDQREQVEAALGRLPASQRAALLLAYVDGMTVREIAQTLGRSEKAIESILSRGRASFRSAYGEIPDG